MGVNGLATFISNEYKKKGAPIAEDVTLTLGNCKGKTFAIDGLNVMYRVIDHVWRGGTDYYALFGAFHKYFSNLLKTGLECHVFMDGLSAEAKDETAKSRFISRAKKHDEFAASITKGKPKLSGIRPLFRESIMLDAINQVNKEAAEVPERGIIVVIYSGYEADSEIAEFYAKNSETCIGVLSNDTDFFVFPHVKCFPVNDFYVTDQSVRGICYHSDKMLEHFRISFKQFSVALLHSGTDRCESKPLGVKQDQIQLAIDQVRDVDVDNSEELDRYLKVYWKDQLEQCHEALQFYNTSVPNLVSTVSTLLGEVGETGVAIESGIIKRLSLNPVCVKSIAFLFAEQGYQCLSACSAYDNGTIWRKTAYIREQIFSLFKKYLDVKFNGIIRERVCTKQRESVIIKNTNIVLEDVQEQMAVSRVQLDSILNRDDTPELREPHEYVSDSEFVCFEDIDAMNIHQRTMLSFFIMLRDFIEEETFSSFWMSNDQDQQFLCALLVLCNIHDVEEWEVKVLCYLRALQKTEPSQKNVPFNEYQQHAARSNKLFSCFELIVLHQIDLNTICNISYKNETMLNSRVFYEVYLATAANPKKEIETDPETEVVINQYVAQLKQNGAQFFTRPVRRDNAKKKNRAKPNPIQKKTAGKFLSNGFSSLSIDEEVSSDESSQQNADSTQVKSVSRGADWAKKAQQCSKKKADTAAPKYGGWGPRGSEKVDERPRWGSTTRTEPDKPHNDTNERPSWRQSRNTPNEQGTNERKDQSQKDSIERSGWGRKPKVEYTGNKNVGWGRKKPQNSPTSTNLSESDDGFITVVPKK